LSDAEIDRMVFVDYDEEMALVAARPRATGGESLVGVARYIRTGDKATAEFAVVIADTWQRTGLGLVLLTSLFRIGAAAGLEYIFGLTLADNRGMKRLAQKMGMALSQAPDDSRVTLLTAKLPLPAHLDQCAVVESGGL
jgi:acetyltransferase